MTATGDRPSNERLRTIIKALYAHGPATYDPDRDYERSKCFWCGADLRRMRGRMQRNAQGEAVMLRERAEPVHAADCPWPAIEAEASRA